MSQRGSGQAPFPADHSAGRRRAANGRSADRSAVDRAGGYTYDESVPGYEADDLDPLEIDRYLESRARQAAPADDLGQEVEQPRSTFGTSGSRWSSSSRRRRRGQPAPPVEADEVEPVAPAPPRRAGRVPPPPYDDEPVAEAYADDLEVGDYDDVDDPYAFAPAPRSRGRARRAARPRPQVVMPTIRVPASVSSADIVRDPAALALLGTAALVTLVMALVTLSRVGDLPAAIELRYDAFGLPARWGPPKSLWQLPLLGAMVTLINLVLAVTLSRYDRFASRFVLAAAIVVGLLTWVPAARFLW